MTILIFYEICLVALAFFALFWSGEELWRHTRYKNQPHRWHWHANKAENRSADILWLHDRFWIIIRFVGAVVGAGFVAHFVMR